jgi:polyferredoxin
MTATVARRSAYTARRPDEEPAGFDLLRVPFLGRLLRWRGVRVLLQVPLFLLSAVLVLHGLYGPDLAPKNLATVVTWVHYRGLLVLVLLAAGNLFCLACPFLLPREIARWLFRPVWNWPQRLRNKWFAVVLFVLILFVYEQFALWSNPLWTAWLIAGYFAAALVVDAVFKHASFCKWLCPIGQFNFIASTMSPLEIRVRDLHVCSDCRTKDCIRGRHELDREETGRRALPLVSQRGCELALFQPMKVGNLDCTFCLDCVHACPHDNVGLMSRLPGAELWAGGSRSGIGQPHTRKDMAALVAVFTFGALLNAFAMTSPVYAVENWLCSVCRTNERGPILGVLFLLGLVVEPVVLLGLSAAATKYATGSRQGIAALAARYAFSMVPLGFGVWLAHYSFHFLTGALTVIPVTHAALSDVVGGSPNWDLAGMRVGPVYALELGFLTLGFVGSWIVAIRLARQDHAEAPRRAYLPWVVLSTLLWISAVWILTQPMDMRGTFMGP